MYKYHIENGTNMELWYECECGGDRFSGIILPTSDVQRQIHGINHSMTVVASGAELRCVLKSTADMRKPGKLLHLYGNSINHITVQCRAPFGEVCNPVEMMVSGKQLFL